MMDPSHVIDLGKDEAELVSDIIADGFFEDPVCARAASRTAASAAATALERGGPAGP